VPARAGQNDIEKQAEQDVGHDHEKDEGEVHVLGQHAQILRSSPIALDVAIRPASLRYLSCFGLLGLTGRPS
jgi:hypothetical protein